MSGHATPLLARLAGISTRDLADRNISPGEAKDLLELVEAAMGAVILIYDPSKTDAQNDEYQRRARRLNKALAKFSWPPPSKTAP
jgi:hypothetical protein